MLYDDNHFSDMPQPDRLLPPWCWWLVVALSCADCATTLLGKRLNIVDRNPLYTHAGTLPWLLLVTHAALLLLLALIARLHRRVGIVGAIAMTLIYLPAVVLNTALLLLVVR